jgi:hypothetical protein
MQQAMVGYSRQLINIAYISITVCNLVVRILHDYEIKNFTILIFVLFFYMFIENRSNGKTKYKLNIV